jgi:fucose 4-O-acetylase-like acetyltransferase
VTTAPARSKHVDAMLGLGIVFVVMGHRYQPEWLFFPAYTFHMALFFFISGMLARVQPGLPAKLRFLGKKSRTQLLRYFQYNLFFAAVTWLLSLAGVPLGYAVPSFESKAAALQSVRDFFVVPFLDGHQYHLHAAAWFLLQLYLVHIVFQLVIYSARRGFVLAMLALTLPVTLLLLHAGLARFDDWRMTGVRTAFAFLFFLAGYVVKSEEARLRPVLLHPAALVACFALVNVLAVNFGNIRYNIVLANIGNPRVWVPVLATALIVAMVYQVAWHLAGLLDEGAALLRLGRATLPILLWHFSVFFAINALLFAMGLVTKAQLSDNWFILQPKKTWLLYEVPALFAPLAIDRLLGRLRARLPL